MANEFQVTSLDPDQLKDSLIEFFQSNPEFSDIDYEGSAINNVVDLLVYNAHISSYEANMVANESFLQSSQIRGNASAHAQKLSYMPRSRTSARLFCDLTVTPASNPNLNAITADKGKTFLRAVDGTTFTFTNPSSVTLFWDEVNEVFEASDVELVQGQLVSNQFVYAPSGNDNRKLFIPNTDIDTSTLRVFVKDNPTAQRETEYAVADDIGDLGPDRNVFFLSESRKEQYFIEFGRDVLGNEPANNSVIRVEYVVTQDQHGNGISELIAGSTIQGYSNIAVNVTTPAFGGYEKADLEEIKFIAPRAFQAQDRAVRESDYELIVKERFPFIQSVRVWGGEKNNPPYYGRVFISIVPESGIIVTEAIKRQIKEYVMTKNVTAIIPEIVEPIYIDIEMDGFLILNRDNTRRTFNEAVATVQSEVQDYADTLLNFGEYYNESLLINNIKQKDKGVESIRFEKTVVATKTSRPDKHHKYTVRFGNDLEPETVKVSDISVDINNDDRIEDDGQGNMILISGMSERDVGTVDYETGVVDFTITNLLSQDIRVEAVPAEANIYTDNTVILRLNKPSVEQEFRTQ